MCLPEIKNKSINIHKKIYSYRYLAAGITFIDLLYTFRIGIKTISYIVREVCATIWFELCEVYMKIPSEEEWLVIANNFEGALDFPLFFRSYRRQAYTSDKATRKWINVSKLKTLLFHCVNGRGRFKL